MRPDLGRLFGQQPISEPLDLPGPAIIPGGKAAPELCQLARRWAPELHPDDAIGDVKLDGHRALYIGGQLVSREGNPMPQAAYSYRALQELERAFGKPMFFDGEYVHPEGLGACARPGGTIWLWDAVPLDLWRREADTAPLIDRRYMLMDRGQHCFGPALGALIPFRLPSKAEAKRKAHELIAIGYEGIIVKPALGRYWRRRRAWYKLKDWRTVPCRIVEWISQPAGTPAIKALIVKHDGKLNRITGFDRGMAALLWGRRDDLIGATADIEFAGYTSNGLMRDAAFIGMGAPR